MKSYITVFSGAAICILVEAMLAMVIYAALRVLTEIDVSALWVGSCILAGCLFISAGTMQQSRKQPGKSPSMS